MITKKRFKEIKERIEMAGAASVPGVAIRCWEPLVGPGGFFGDLKELLGHVHELEARHERLIENIGQYIEPWWREEKI